MYKRERERQRERERDKKKSTDGERKGNDIESKKYIYM